MKIRSDEDKGARWLAGPMISWLLVLAWAALIFFLSSLEGGIHSDPMPIWFLIERKGAHIFEYLILTLLTARALRIHMPPRAAVRVWWLSAFLSGIYAVSDEVHQLFVFGRTGKPTDVLIDGIGIALALLILIVRSRPQSFSENREEKKEVIETQKTKRRARRRIV